MNVTTISEPSASLIPAALPLLELLITIVGIAVTALLVIWQIRKQFDHSLQLQWQQSKDKLKIELYEQLLGGITDAATAAAEAAGYARQLNLSIVAYWAVRIQGLEPSYIKERAPNFAFKKNELSDKVLNSLLT